MTKSEREEGMFFRQYIPVGPAYSAARRIAAVDGRREPWGIYLWLALTTVVFYFLCYEEPMVKHVFWGVLSPLQNEKY